MKIEKTPTNLGAVRRNGLLLEFVSALKVMEVGQSVTLPVTNVSSTFRQMISAAQMILERKFTTRTEGKNIRVARIS